MPVRARSLRHGGIRLFDETREYVVKVLGYYRAVPRRELAA